MVERAGEAAARRGGGCLAPALPVVGATVIAAGLVLRLMVGEPSSTAGTGGALAGLAHALGLAAIIFGAIVLIAAVALLIVAHRRTR